MSVTLIVFVSVLLVASLTAGATSVRMVSRIWLRHWVEQRLTGSVERALSLDRPTRLLLAAGTGVALTVFGAGICLAVVHGGASLLLARDVVVLLTAVLMLGQLVPRAVARRWPTALVPVLVPFLRIVDLIVTPFRLVADGVARFVVPNRPSVTAPTEQDELRDLLREGELEGISPREEADLISDVVAFGEKRVRDVMTPASDLFSLDIALPPLDLAQRMAHAAFSRVPIYRDNPNNIVGMLHAFDVLKAEGERTPPLRPVGSAQPDQAANELLFAMLKARRHLSVVRGADETVIGIVTLEDLLEELVGDIRDEHDDPSPSPSSR
jgi:putative hemolysin